MFIKKHIFLVTLFGITASLPFEMSASYKTKSGHKGAKNYFKGLLYQSAAKEICGQSVYNATKKLGHTYSRVDDHKNENKPAALSLTQKYHLYEVVLQNPYAPFDAWRPE